MHSHSYLPFCLCPLFLYSLVEPILEKFKFDFNSDAPLDEQELEGCKRLRKYCLECVEETKQEREARVEKAKEAYQAQLQEEEELRMKVSSLPVSTYLSIRLGKSTQFHLYIFLLARINRRMNLRGPRRRRSVSGKRRLRSNYLRRRKSVQGPKRRRSVPGNRRLRSNLRRRKSVQGPKRKKQERKKLRRQKLPSSNVSVS